MRPTRSGRGESNAIATETITARQNCRWWPILSIVRERSWADQHERATAVMRQRRVPHLRGSGLLPTSNIGATWDIAAEWPNCAPMHAVASRMVEAASSAGCAISFPVSCTIARFCSSVKRGGSVAAPLLGVSSDTQRAQLAALPNSRPGTPMKQGTPVHFVRPCSRRSRRAANAMRDQRCGMLGVSRSTAVHRFEMPARERLKFKRTAVRVHAVAMRGRLLSALQWFLLLLPFRRFLGQIL